jgi:serine phosphatase RsbU (regulator of sigma subunit)/catechol 2,3-dioxygenase-like lactoylglutathione lyase family enzyme
MRERAAREAPIITFMGTAASREEVNQSAVRLERQHPYLRIDAVNVFVKDLDRSVAFYTEVLGFDLAMDTRTQSGYRLVAVAPPDGTAVLRLIAPDPDSDDYQLIGRSAPIVLLTEDVVVQYREWTKRGVRFRYTPRLRRVKSHAHASAAEQPVWGGIFTRFEDIDGNLFSLVEFDDESRAIEEQRRSVTEKLEADRRAAQELEIARMVQARLFPQTLPPMGTLEYAGVCAQARQVGGDYYDFLNLGQDRLGLVVGDIAGKGIAAALLMANLQANLRSQCAVASEHPDRFLHSVNQLFFENTIESAYATLFFAEYDNRSRRLRYANCGHLPGLILRTGGTLDRLASTCTVLGLFQNWDCGIAEDALFPGDTLVLYTDGVTEAFDELEEQFGELRLIESLRRHRERPAQELLDAILGEVKRFSPCEQHDDMTLLVARCA